MLKKILIGIILVMGVVSCVIPVSASVFTINPGTGNMIQSAINSASSGDTIVLNPGTYSENGITITGKNLILRAADGHGPSDTIIDGKSVAPRIFTVTDASSLVIENLALRNGRAGDAADCGDPFISLGNECGDGGYGGAIYSGGNVVLRNSTITGSKAGNGAYGSDPFLGLGGNGGSGGHGGAIYATGAVTLTSSSISGCFGGDAGDGGEDDPFLGGEGMGGAGGSGGAIYATGTVTLISSTVTDSHAGNGGTGAYQKVGFASAGGSGGAIYGSGVVTLVSSTISSCSAGTGGAGGNDNRGYDGGNGGAISAGGAVTITSSTISGCSAGDGGDGGHGSEGANMGSWGGDGGHGGAISSNGLVMVSSSTISDCTAGNGGNGGGGAWMAGKGADGSPGGNGGAIYSKSSVSLTAATIASCSAGNGGNGGHSHWWRDGGNGGSGGSGGAVGATGTVAVVSSAITGSTSGAGGAGGSGGSMASDGTSGWPGNGGGISTGSSVTASSSTFSGCYATYGGAVDAGSANADSSVFTGCSALSNGGAVYAQSVMITSTTLEGCNAFLGSGGAVSADSGTIRFSRLFNNEGMVWFPLTHDGDDITGSIDARYNWWGANSIVSSRVMDGVAHSPNLILTATATPPSIGKSKSSLIEANLTVDSAGTWHDPVYGHVPDGIPVTFAITSGPGSISPNSAVTADGVAQTTFTSSAIGTATVTATVDEQQAPVSILIDPEARFTLTDRSVIRQQQEAEFIDQSLSTLPLTYLWEFGDGAISTEQNPKHVYRKEGVYNITLTVTNAIGSDTLKKQDYVFVTTPNPIHANFVAVNKAGPSPLMVSFTDTSIKADIPGYPALNSWSWDFGDGTNSNQQNPNHLYQNAGRYNVTLTVSNSIDNDSKTKDFIVVVPVKNTAQVPKKVYLKLS